VAETLDQWNHLYAQRGRRRMESGNRFGRIPVNAGVKVPDFAGENVPLCI
jgi:hypothetical protein